MSYSVLVYDDDPDLAASWQDNISEVVTGEYNLLPVLTKNDARHAAQELLRRRSASRKRNPLELEGCPFDDADILIIDYDLLHIAGDNAQYTGESMARLTRMFSDCGVLVVLNQFPGMQFDLSLRGHIVSHADLNINGELLAKPGLWQNPPWNGFRPWSWETLSQAVETHKGRMNIVNDALDKPIVEVFGMQSNDVLRLSDTAFGFIAPDAKELSSFETTTFRDFILNASGDRDLETLLECNKKSAVRFIAARIGKWLEREVLGPQDVLVDVPHLLQRFPFLFEEEKITNLNAWNETIHNVDPLRDIIGQSYWFQPEKFLSRPAVWGQRLEMDDEISKKRSEFDFTRVPDFVFLEDYSVFTSFERATEFRAGFHNSYDRRFIMNDEDIRYAPQRRFAFGN